MIFNVFLDERKVALMHHIYMYICIVTHCQSFLQNPLDGCVRNVVGMKYSLPTCIVAFRQTPPRDESRAGKNR